MHILIYPEIIRITLIIGLTGALLFKKKFGFNPGGIVIPAYLAMIFDNSMLWFGVIQLVGFLVYGSYYLFFKKLALPSHQLMAVLSIISVTSTLLASYVVSKLGLTVFESIDSLVGLIVPALMTITAIKVGWAKTITSSWGVAAITYLLALGLAFLIKDFSPDLTSFSQQLHQNLSIARSPTLLPELIVSVLVAAIAYWKFKVRIGGFVILPAIVALIPTPVDLLMFLLITLLVYGLVNHVFARVTFVYGLTRFVYMTITSLILVWIYEYIAMIKFNYVPFYASFLIIPIAVAVWANDAALQGFKKSAIGFSLAMGIGYISSVVLHLLAEKIILG